MEHDEIKEIVHSIFLQEFQKMGATDWAVYIADKSGFHSFGISGQRFLNEISVEAGTAVLGGHAKTALLPGTLLQKSARLTPQEYQELITGKKP